MAWCYLPSLHSSQPLGHCSCLSNLFFVVRQARSPVNVQTNKHSLLFLSPQWCPRGRNKRNGGGGCCLGPVCPLVSLQRAEVPLLRDAQVGATAPNLGPAGLFLPIRPFSPVSRPNSDTNHSSWLPQRSRELPESVEGDPRSLVLSFTTNLRVRDPWRLRFASQVSLPRTAIPADTLFFKNRHSSVCLPDFFSAIFRLHPYPTSLPPSRHYWEKGLNPRAKV